MKEVVRIKKVMVIHMVTSSFMKRFAMKGYVRWLVKKPEEVNLGYSRMGAFSLRNEKLD